MVVRWACLLIPEVLVRVQLVTFVSPVHHPFHLVWLQPGEGFHTRPYSRHKFLTNRNEKNESISFFHQADRKKKSNLKPNCTSSTKKQVSVIPPRQWNILTWGLFPHWLFYDKEKWGSPRSGEGNGWRWFEADVILGIPIWRDRDKKTIKLSNLRYILSSKAPWFVWS